MLIKKTLIERILEAGQISLRSWTERANGVYQVRDTVSIIRDDAGWFLMREEKGGRYNSTNFYGRITNFCANMDLHRQEDGECNAFSSPEEAALAAINLFNILSIDRNGNCVLKGG